MNAPCAACVAGPSSIVGHPDLMVQSLGNSRQTFKCRHCDTLWSRSGKRAGEFAWQALADPQARGTEIGVVLPPRSDFRYLRA
jgi:hypothetical protein